MYSTGNLAAGLLMGFIGRLFARAPSWPNHP
jgi:hypothetical protein